MLTDDQVKARNCLASGSWLVDPKYLYPREQAEEKLKARCRECWHLREFWPQWVKDYADKWAKEKA